MMCTGRGWKAGDAGSFFWPQMEEWKKARLTQQGARLPSIPPLCSPPIAHAPRTHPPNLLLGSQLREARFPHHLAEEEQNRSLPLVALAELLAEPTKQSGYTRLIKSTIKAKEGASGAEDAHW